MSSRWSLVVLSVLALVSVAVVAVDRGDNTEAVQRDRRLSPIYARASVRGLRIERPGSKPVQIRSVEGVLRMTAPVKASLDGAAIDDLLGTIEVASYRRAVARTPAHGLEAPRVVLTLDLDGKPVAISLGARVAGIDRVWVGRSGDSRSFLIDGYVERALNRTVDSLRSRRVFFAHPEEVTGVEAHAGSASMILSGAPLAVHRRGPGKVRMDAAAAKRLLSLLDELVLRRFVAPAAGAPPRDSALLTVRVIGSHPTRSLEEVGGCPGAGDMRLVQTTAGTGCVRARDLAAIVAIVSKPTAAYDRSLLGVQPMSTLGIESGTDKVALRRWGAGWRFDNGKDASTGAVDKVLAELARVRDSFVEIPDGARVVTRVAVWAGGETRQIHIMATKAGHVARRGDEPIGFAIAPGAAARISSRALDYRSRALIARESANLVEAVSRRGGAVGQHVVRGTLLEDWSVRVPRGRAPLLDGIRRLRQTGATLRARRFVAASAVAAHGFGRATRVVELQFDQPFDKGRARVSHRITMGKRSAAGCFARLDDDPTVFELDREACAALTGPWTK